MFIITLHFKLDKIVHLCRLLCTYNQQGVLQQIAQKEGTEWDEEIIQNDSNHKFETQLLHSFLAYFRNAQFLKRKTHFCCVYACFSWTTPTWWRGCCSSTSTRALRDGWTGLHTRWLLAVAKRSVIFICFKHKRAHEGKYSFKYTWKKITLGTTTAVIVCTNKL